MKDSLFLLFAGVIISVTGCRQSPDSQIILQERLLSSTNPTNYDFEAGISEVKIAIKNACGDEWRKELAKKREGKVWKGTGDSYSKRLLSRALQEPVPRLFWKGDADALAKYLLTIPGNENDAYVYNADAPVESQVYFKDGQPLIYYADFHIHITAVDHRKTRVEIFTRDSNVGVGVDEKWSAHGPRLIRVKVEPTTVEEYQVLLRIGKHLEKKEMPPLVTPGSSSPVKQLIKPRQS